VLFFFGSDAAWGILMLGERPEATFAKWHNDGLVQRVPWTFSELIERLIANDFAHTWAYDSHPETDAVEALIARPHTRRAARAARSRRALHVDRAGLGLASGLCSRGDCG
jgi:hypothetical protein